MEKKSTVAKVLKIVAIVVAIAAAIAGVCVLVKKLAAKKQAEISHPEEEELLSCVNEEEFSAVTVDPETTEETAE